jgi:hypothetical protein
VAEFCGVFFELRLALIPHFFGRHGKKAVQASSAMINGHDYGKFQDFI